MLNSSSFIQHFFSIWYTNYFYYLLHEISKLQPIKCIYRKHYATSKHKNILCPKKDLKMKLNSIAHNPVLCNLNVFVTLQHLKVTLLNMHAEVSHNKSDLTCRKTHVTGSNEPSPSSETVSLVPSFSFTCSHTHFPVFVLSK